MRGRGRPATLAAARAGVWASGPVVVTFPFSRRKALVGQLFDIVGEAVELPLPIHLGPSPEGEAIQPLVAAEVAEHRLHGGETPAVTAAGSSMPMARFMRSVWFSGAAWDLPRKPLPLAVYSAYLSWVGLECNHGAGIGRRNRHPGKRLRLSPGETGPCPQASSSFTPRIDCRHPVVKPAVSPGAGRPAGGPGRPSRRWRPAGRSPGRSGGK